jgi:hypothetical protein
MGWEPGEEDERFGWDEYLLYNAKRGFIFLVDSEEGWSIVKPTTGAPSLSPNGQSAVYLNTGYALQYSYHAETNYVAGEFYWPVERGQRTFNRDFSKGTSLLSLEETPRERTWSSGSRVDASLITKAFNLQKSAGRGGDAGPTTPKGAGSGLGCGTIMIIILVILILLALLKACDDDDRGGSGYRSSGGSYGGYSSGGGHK